MRARAPGGVAHPVLPLSAFATYAFWGGAAPDQRRWLDAYQLGAALAIVSMAIAMAGREPVNRLMLGANVYLLAGGGAVLTRQWRVLEILGALRESGIFLSMLTVGLVTTAATRAGYVGVPSPDASRVRRYSVYLLACTAAAVGIALAFQGSRVVAALVPIVMLVVARRSLSDRLRQPGTADGREGDTLESVLRMPVALLGGGLAVRAVGAIEPYGWGWAMALAVAVAGAAIAGWLATVALRRLRQR